MGIFKIQVKTKVWDKHWLELPPRDYHDIFSMLSKNLVNIDGDITPFIQNLQYFKDLIASYRKIKNEHPQP